jgi:hypothetical protein
VGELSLAHTVAKHVRNRDGKGLKKQCAVVTDNPTFHSTGDSRYTRFHYPRFRISAVLFQYYEEYLSYPRLNFKAYYLRRNFSKLIGECDAYDNLGIKEF